MAVSKKSLENLEKRKQFSSTEQPENRGRKPSALRFIREHGVSITDIKKITESLIWAYDSDELAELLQTIKVKVKDASGKVKTITKTKKPLPMGVNLILSALNADLKSKSLINYEKLMDRAYGKATQKDIIEFRDISDSAKGRLERIFGEVQEESSKIKPKVVSKIISGKHKKSDD